MISSILTPVRWYNTLHEQDRFNVDCDICDFELISDKTRLLPFQFRRPKSGYFFDKWFLRKACENPAEPLLNDNDSLFTIDTSFWDKTQFTFVNGKIKAPGNTISQLNRAGIFTVGKYYTIKIVVSEFNKQVGSDFNVHGYYLDTATPFFNFSGPGTYTATFLADTTDFSIEGLDGESTDYITIESIQIYEYKSFDDEIGDIDLDLDLINLVNVGDSDIISYCGSDFQFQIPCGKYYMVMISTDNVIYYSEVITVKDFIPSQSPYTLLEWKNSCDLSDVKFQAINDCAYSNRLYINGPLTHPEYPFKEEAEEDGNQNMNVTFQKWEKKQSLIAPKCPEFIVDALTAIRLHDEIFITKPLRKKQIQVLEAIEVDKVEYDVQYVFNDCAANVELKLLLKDKVVDSTCCSNIEVTGCNECEYTVSGIDELTEDNLYFGNLFDEDFNLFEITVLLNMAITGHSTGSPLSGFQYKILGDHTLDFPVGTTIYVVGTLGLGNNGFHIVSDVAYDSGTNMTSIQWDGIVTYFGESISGFIKKISYENITQDGTIVCVTGEDYPYYNQNNEYWSQTPIINNVVDTDMGGGVHQYTIYGFVYPGTFVRLTVEIYNIDTTATTTIEYPYAYTAADLYSGIIISSETFGIEFPENCIVSFTVNNYDISCNYGDSNTYDITYATTLFHPVFQEWYDGLEGDKPSLELAIDANNFIQGLDDDGILDEFDLLHFLAAWETDEQRTTPIISTSGEAFLSSGTHTFNASGFYGDGIDGYLSLKWKPAIHGVKYQQDDASFGIYISNDINGDMCDMGIKHTGVTHIFADNNFGYFAGAINDGLESVNANTGTIGLFSMIRDGALSQRAAKNTSLFPINATISLALLDVEFTVGARNYNGTIEKFSNRNYQFVYVGSKLVDMTALYNRVTTFLTARGL